MVPEEKQATPQVAFVFLGPLTNESPAYAGSKARQCGICFSWAINEGSACVAGSGARQRGKPESKKSP